ncbi:hypothetical protein PIB30_036927 [Stylosanthes scabra]|uniref:AT-hook motif nuclear-localized protein n=1 Tax=Stylosanthes scabra TaxID=79078 RepID=A0ABU6SDN2_9FABA|nr:hypothetical protein [Stylosanthes scabra]
MNLNKFVMRDSSRGKGTGKGRGRPRKNTEIRLNLDTPHQNTITTTTPSVVATEGLSVGLSRMVMILTPGSRVQSSDMGGARQVHQSPPVPQKQMPPPTSGTRS